MLEKILHRIYADRDSFSAEELAFVGGVVSAYNEERAARAKAVALPTRFVAVGDMVMVAGHSMRCVRRPSDVWPPSEACKGCSLSRLYLGCGDLQCSLFDRRDKKNVWFVEDEKKECD